MKNGTMLAAERCRGWKRGAVNDALANQILNGIKETLANKKNKKANNRSSECITCRFGKEADIG